MRIIQTKPVAFAVLELDIKHHLNSLPSAIDSFLEDHILESNHYEISISNQKAGFASIHKGSLITQFVLDPPYKRLGQLVFQAVRRLEEVQAAFVPTSDEFFLAHALDDYRQLIRQAYFFTSLPQLPQHPTADIALRLARASDLNTIEAGSGDFFAPIEASIQKQQIYLVEQDQICVAFGILQQSRLIANTASIGMFVQEGFRQQGIGTMTLQLLQLECQRQSLQAVAGCWYYNHLSKKTLERAGMFAQTRLFKIEF